MFIGGACTRASGAYKLRPSYRQRGSKPGYLLFFISKNPVIQFLQCMQPALPISHFLAFYGAMIHHSISAVLMAGLALSWRTPSFTPQAPDNGTHTPVKIYWYDCAQVALQDNCSSEKSNQGKNCTRRKLIIFVDELSGYCE